jgi:hypothetical protein
MFSETSGLTRATWCNTSEDIRHCYRREDIPEDGVLRPYTVLSELSCIISGRAHVDVGYNTSTVPCESYKGTKSGRDFWDTLSLWVLVLQTREWTRG